MQVGQFPASAANSLIEGYCDDFISLASILAQALEQVSMRSIDISRSADHLVRIESGMRELSEAIRDLIERGRVSTLKTEGLLAEQGAQGLLGTASVIANCSDWLSPSAADPTGEGPCDEEIGPTKPANFSEQVAREFGTDFSKEEVLDPILEMQLEEAGLVDESTEDTPAEPEEDESTDRLEGSAQTMPILPVFQFLERMRKSGVITVSMPDETMTFEFDHGCVQSCTTTSTEHDDRLGDILLELETCDAEPLTEILDQAAGKSSLQVGEMIVRARLATNGEIIDALETQARRRFRRACEAEEASYHFVEGTARRTDGRIRIAPMELSFDAGWQLV